MNEINFKRVAIIGLMGVIIAIVVIILTSSIGNSSKLNESLEKIEDNTIYPEWMNYIRNYNIKKIVLVKSEIGKEDINKELTKDDLDKIFKYLLKHNKKLLKVYIDSLGFMGGNTLTVSFKNNDLSYKFEIRDGMIFCFDEVSGRSDNEEFFKLIDREDIEEINKGLYSEYVYKYENVLVFDEYLK